MTTPLLHWFASQWIDLFSWDITATHSPQILLTGDCDFQTLDFGRCFKSKIFFIWKAWQDRILEHFISMRFEKNISTGLRNEKSTLHHYLFCFIMDFQIIHYCPSIERPQWENTLTQPCNLKVKKTKLKITKFLVYQDNERASWRSIKSRFTITPWDLVSIPNLKFSVWLTRCKFSWLENWKFTFLIISS